MKIQYVCPYCGSNDISADANATWSIEKQEWEISGIHDTFWCNNCEQDIKGYRLVEEPVK
jgi:Zn finger protein HypA/HybF involved in hydrogenase expression